MKIHFICLLIPICFILSNISIAQELNYTDQSNGKPELFESEQVLPIKLSFSNKDLKKNTNDSTYVRTDLSYQSKDNSWETLSVGIRARGNYRRANCDFPPIKLKIKKSDAKETLFEGNRKLKLVLPCLKLKNINDDLIKEFIAYKLYEVVSPYHFNTRLVHIELVEIRAKNDIPHELYGIFIEQDKNLAKRFNGRELERTTNQMYLDTLSSVQIDFFQFMIANTDYSNAYQHNAKLFLIDGKMIPVPYDFDMSGFVDARYAVVAEIQDEELPITDVTQRLYRGFDRNPAVFEQVRNQYQNNKSTMLEVIDSYETLFTDPKEFSKAKDFIIEFFEIIENDKEFNREIVDRARTK